MKLIITGASGGFGRGATLGLLQQQVSPADLILVTRRPDSLTEMAALGCDVRQGDFDDYDSLLKAFEGGDRMLMISTSRVGQRMPQHSNAVNAAKHCGVQHVVYTSFVGAVPDNPSLAVRDHRGTEALLRDTRMAWTALRNSQYADYIFAAAPNAIRLGKWYSSTGDGTLAHVCREDCIAAAVAVMGGSGHENRVYDITGPELLSVRQVADIIREVTGRHFDFVETTDEGMYAYFDSLGVPRAPIDDKVASDIPWCSDDMVSFERTIREGRFRILSGEVKALTGHAPKSLRQLAREHVNWLLPK